MDKRWVLKKQGDENIVKHLSEVLNIDLNLANLLAQRGVSTFDEARLFFRPSLEELHDPFLMNDMHNAVDRIEAAIKKGEKILVYGDYDVDGTTAVALVYTFLRSIYSNIDFYVPDRYQEGYGISYKSIDFAAEQGFTLVIVLDCGIKAVEKIAYAKEKGIDYIIADHHRPGDVLPEAVAVLDPKRPDSTYPYDELSGCGVGFKLIQAYTQKHNMPFENLVQYLDLVVVSIASDIVKITGENRILAYYGLKIINTDPRPGIEAILNVVGINRKVSSIVDDSDYIFNKNLTISDLVFQVGPRINAAGRIESANNSVSLLVAENLPMAHEFADMINNFNTERKDLDAQTTLEATEMIRDNNVFQRARATIVYNPSWHKGVIGIVASRLIETYYKPTIVLTKSNGLITGSARSVKDFDIYDAVDACSDLLEHFGGHKYAAGLSLKPENLDHFRKRFEEFVDANITQTMTIPEVEIDERICLNDINKKFFRILKQFAPFGPGNMSPVFESENLIDTGSGRVVGKNHLKLEVVHKDIRGYPIPAIAFQQSEHIDLIKQNKPFNICYHIEENEWNGVVNLQLNIKDIKPMNEEDQHYAF
ncbi:MAG TPA: single-stranded-DNA-specific exonuclease RecJ [Bacteroidales bacterium]|nr:single-stranded-DNA-specific exonuclease RecJ [Bacteroidales bacterium]HRX96188.1 single-stranded-DNA-specific exonuclease RecJ [Bacteroidales bacterium]